MFPISVELKRRIIFNEKIPRAKKASGGDDDVVEEDDESEEDDSTTDAERKARMFRKRKALTGWGNSVSYQSDLIKIPRSHYSGSFRLM